MLRAAEAGPPSPSEFAPSTAPDLDRLCLELLRRDPEARPKSTEILNGRKAHTGEAASVGLYLAFSVPDGLAHEENLIRFRQGVRLAGYASLRHLPYGRFRGCESARIQECHLDLERPNHVGDYIGRWPAGETWRFSRRRDGSDAGLSDELRIPPHHLWTCHPRELRSSES